MATTSQLIANPRRVNKEKTKVPALGSHRRSAAFVRACTRRRRRSRTRRCAKWRVCVSSTVRSFLVHRRRRPQPPGALGGAHPRRSREGSSRRSLSHRARHARLRRRRQPHAGPLQVRRQAREEVRGITNVTSHSSTHPPHPAGPEVQHRHARQVHERRDEERQEVGRRTHHLRRDRPHRREDRQAGTDAAGCCRPRSTT